MFAIGTILEIRRGAYRHVALSLGNGQVLQNTPERGEEIVPLAEFAKGLKIAARPTPRIQALSFLQRVSKIVAHPRRYHVLFNNCEHTVYWAVYGRAVSPQLAGIAIAITVVGIAIWATSKSD